VQEFEETVRVAAVIDFHIVSLASFCCCRRILLYSQNNNILFFDFHMCIKELYTEKEKERQRQREREREKDTAAFSMIYAF